MLCRLPGSCAAQGHSQLWPLGIDPSCCVCGYTALVWRVLPLLSVLPGMYCLPFQVVDSPVDSTHLFACPFPQALQTWQTRAAAAPPTRALSLPYSPPTPSAAIRTPFHAAHFLPALALPSDPFCFVPPHRPVVPPCPCPPQFTHHITNQASLPGFGKCPCALPCCCPVRHPKHAPVQPPTSPFLPSACHIVGSVHLACEHHFMCPPAPPFLISRHAFEAAARAEHPPFQTTHTLSFVHPYLRACDVPPPLDRPATAAPSHPCPPMSFCVGEINHIMPILSLPRGRLYSNLHLSSLIAPRH